MKAAAFMGKKDIRVVEVPEPRLEEDGVIIKMKACGICGSDMHVYNSDLLTEDSTEVIQNYRIIGHEFTGEIVEVGKKVEYFKPGDRVASVHNKGGMAEYVEVHGKRLNNLFKIPEGISYETAATLEPFCNPMHSFYMRELKDQETVAIFGAGIIGLGYLQIVKTYTDARTIAVDISSLRLEAAKKIGADEVINPRNQDPVRTIKKLTSEHYVRYQDKTAGGCDVSIDCAGIPLTFEQCLEVLKPENGTAIIAAVYEDTARIDPNMILFKYMSILGSMGYSPSETREALHLTGSGKVNRDILITQKYPLDQAAQGFETQGKPHQCIKVVILSD
ncbi:MAG: zinc-dependent alcohol dehydrogenase [Spirochaetota bacterium]